MSQGPEDTPDDPRSLWSRLDPCSITLSCLCFALACVPCDSLPCFSPCLCCHLSVHPLLECVVLVFSPAGLLVLFPLFICPLSCCVSRPVVLPFVSYLLSAPWSVPHVPGLSQGDHKSCFVVVWSLSLRSSSRSHLVSVLYPLLVRTCPVLSSVISVPSWSCGASHALSTRFWGGSQAQPTLSILQYDPPDFTQVCHSCYSQPHCDSSPHLHRVNPL